MEECFEGTGTRVLRVTYIGDGGKSHSIDEPLFVQISQPSKTLRRGIVRKPRRSLELSYQRVHCEMSVRREVSI